MTDPSKRDLERRVADLSEEAVELAPGEPWALMVKLATATDRENPAMALTPAERRKAAAYDYASGGMVPYDGYQADLEAALADAAEPDGEVDR